MSQADIPAPFHLPKIHNLDLFEVTIDQLQEWFHANCLSSVEYVNFCLKRIECADLYLKAVIDTNPDALEIAARLDEERRRGKIRGPLHGIPVLVKDNMATKDKMDTTAGSLALVNSIVPRDAHVVSLLRQAGAIVLGHANMCEWASIRSRDYSTGYSARGDQTRNPYDLSKSPHGSSSGSAVAVSANIVSVSFGTETDTSIIGPASTNGVVGIKPTVGLTSRSGVIPVSENLDTVGCFGRSVADAVHGLDAIVGADSRDAMTTSPSRLQERNYCTFLTDKHALKGAIFGLPRDRMWDSVHGNLKRVASKVFDAIESVGGRIIDTNFPSASQRISCDGSWNWEFGRSFESEGTVVKVDAYNGINAYLSELENTDMKTLEDIIRFNHVHHGVEGAKPGDHPAFRSGQDLFNEIALLHGVKNYDYKQALDYIRRKTRKEGIDAALQFRHPTTGEAATFDALLLCDRKGGGQQYAAQAGYPIISLPIGLDEAGMPVGLSLQHTSWEEGKLIKWASAIEDLVKGMDGKLGRVPPTFRNRSSKNTPVDES